MDSPTSGAGWTGDMPGAPLRTADSRRAFDDYVAPETPRSSVQRLRRPHAAPPRPSWYCATTTAQGKGWFVPGGENLWAKLGVTPWREGVAPFLHPLGEGRRKRPPPFDEGLQILD